MQRRSSRTGLSSGCAHWIGVGGDYRQVEFVGNVEGGADEAGVLVLPDFQVETVGEEGREGAGVGVGAFRFCRRRGPRGEGRGGPPAERAMMPSVAAALSGSMDTQPSFWCIFESRPLRFS